MKVSIFALAAIYILAVFGEHKWVVLVLSLLLIYKYALEKLPVAQ